MSTSIFSSLGGWIQETTWKVQAALGSSDAQSHLNALTAVNSPSVTNEEEIFGPGVSGSDIISGVAQSQAIANAVNAEVILPPGPASWWQGIKDWWAKWKAKYGTTVVIIFLVIAGLFFLWLIRPMFKARTA